MDEVGMGSQLGSSQYFAKCNILLYPFSYCLAIKVILKKRPFDVEKGIQIDFC